MNSIVKFVPVYVYDVSSVLVPSNERKVLRELFDVVFRVLEGE